MELHQKDLLDTPTIKKKKSYLKIVARNLSGLMSPCSHTSGQPTLMKRAASIKMDTS